MKRWGGVESVEYFEDYSREGFELDAEAVSSMDKALPLPPPPYAILAVQGDGKQSYTASWHWKKITG